jgi:hypothetical protein
MPIAAFGDDFMTLEKINLHPIPFVKTSPAGIMNMPNALGTGKASDTQMYTLFRQCHPAEGYGTATGNNWHALLLNGSAQHYVDLNPSGFTISYARGISDTQQVGGGYGTATGNNTHALLWNGSAQTYVDLNPSGFTYSLATGINGTQQVGYGSSTGGYYHALVWNGSAEKYVDLHPSGFAHTYAFAISGTQQVGTGIGSVTVNENHALL